MKKTIIATCIATLLLSGCHSVVRKEVTESPAKAAKKAEPALVGKPDNVTVDKTKFASFNMPKGGSVTQYHEPVGLNKEVPIEPFIGDIENIVYFIATQTGYTYLPYTGIKIAPVIVTYAAQYKTAFESLVEINNNVGKNAYIKISEPMRTLQVVYPISARNYK